MVATEYLEQQESRRTSVGRPLSRPCPVCLDRIYSVYDDIYNMTNLRLMLSQSYRLYSIIKPTSCFRMPLPSLKLRASILRFHRVQAPVYFFTLNSALEFSAMETSASPLSALSSCPQHPSTKTRSNTGDGHSQCIVYGMA